MKKERGENGPEEGGMRRRRRRQRHKEDEDEAAAETFFTTGTISYLLYQEELPLNACFGPFITICSHETSNCLTIKLCSFA